MKTFRVMIEETVSEIFEVEAETLREAKEKTAQKYRAAEFVLEPGNLDCVYMHAVDEDGCNIPEDDWEEI